MGGGGGGRGGGGGGGGWVGLREVRERRLGIGHMHVGALVGWQSRRRCTASSLWLLSPTNPKAAGGCTQVSGRNPDHGAMCAGKAGGRVDWRERLVR
mgnify:CR=1 FL=1